jgi:hypothetical protein
MKQQKTPNFSANLAYFFVFISVFLNGCQKDITPMGIPLPSTSQNSVKEPDISISAARDDFEHKYGASLKVEPNAVTSAVNGDTVVGLPIRYRFTITPTWSGAKIASYLQTRSVLVVPVEPILMLDMLGAEYGLVFYKDSTQQTRSVLQAYMSNNIAAEPNTSNFSGGMFQISMDGKLLNLLKVENGICQSKENFRSIFNSNRPEEEESPDPSKCPDLSGGSRGSAGWWGKFLDFLTPSGPWNPITPQNPFLTMPDTNPFGHGSGVGSGASGNGGVNALQDEIDNNVFGASRTRLLNVVRKLELTNEAKIRLLLYDPLLVTQVTGWLAFNSSPYGKKAANKHLDFLNSEADYKLFNEEENYNVIITDVLEQYITVPGECSCKTIEYTLNSDGDVVLKYQYYPVVPWWTEVMLGSGPAEIAVIPKEHPHYDFLLRKRLEIIKDSYKQYKYNDSLTWVYHLKKNFTPNPYGFDCKSCLPNATPVVLLTGETYKFGTAMDRGSFEESVNRRYESEKTQLGITSFEYWGFTPNIDANMYANQITPNKVRNKVALLIEKILLFNYVLNSPQKAILSSRGINTKNGLPPGHAIFR